MEKTRNKILEIAAEEMHLHGFQSMSIGALLKRLGISKGALYHHFPSKQALGFAVVDEIFAPTCIAEWQPVFDAEDPIQTMLDMFQKFRDEITAEQLVCGCPINNLAQEMSPLDEGFKQRINTVLTHWRAHLAAALARGQVQGSVDPNLEPARMASVIVACIQGTIGLAKNAQDVVLLREVLWGLTEIVERLRPASCQPA